MQANVCKALVACGREFVSMRNRLLTCAAQFRGGVHAHVFGGGHLPALGFGILIPDAAVTGTATTL
jgi:hypothetical protein